MSTSAVHGLGEVTLLETIVEELTKTGMTSCLIMC